jgi:hypothetical protein
MEKLKIDFDEVQKAMEDTEREAFDYFLDRETGDVIILSEEIISKARSVLDEIVEDDMADYEEMVFDKEYDIPDWMEDEIELALDIFLYEKDRYLRIPERNPVSCYAAMKEFAEQTEDVPLKEELLGILDGKGAFRRFKDSLEQYPGERKRWYGFNAKAVKKEIAEWMQAVGANG